MTAETLSKPGDEPAALGAFLARADDRLNPILVKEVRQALRGRYFRNLFWLTVVLATALGVFMIVIANVDGDLDQLGPNFFSATFGVLSFAVHTFVPFWAFQSMGAEWEENTFDLLVISDLRPKQLVIGKVLAATVQALLYYSAFSPFLVSTFLMGGVDILAIGLSIGLSILVSTTLSFLAVALSTLGRTKIVRAALAMLLACALLPVSAGAIGFATMLVQAPNVLRDTDFQYGVAMFVSVLPIVALFAFAIGCARLAHEEENRSSALRVLASAITLVTLAWGAVGYTTFFRGQEHFVIAMVGFGCALAMVAYVFFVTEPEAFGRRVARQVPSSRTLALCSLPWLPGGARGLALLIGNALLTLLVVTPLALLEGDDSLVTFTLALYLYALVIVGLPSGIASHFVRTLRGRTAVRVAIPLLLGLAIFLPSIAGMLLDVHSWMELEHPLDPFWVLACVVEDDWSQAVPGLALLAVGVLLTAVVNAKRVGNAVAEVLRCSAERRARAKANPAPARNPDAAPQP
ncbi:MAG: hypothetical protein IT453_05450 [Planctomycetes bacterium]|nr:hypothetical protein [Planctomycetota bacterium]